jgi:hypothetical protein
VKSPYLPCSYIFHISLKAPLDYIGARESLIVEQMGYIDYVLEASDIWRTFLIAQVVGTFFATSILITSSLRSIHYLTLSTIDDYHTSTFLAGIAYTTRFTHGLFFLLILFSFCALTYLLIYDSRDLNGVYWQVINSIPTYQY